MKLIGAGLPRTATSTQKVVMDILGLTPCYHMQNVFADLDEAARWQAALTDAAVLQEIVDPFESTIDWPGSYHYRTLAELYPDAKVLLSVRTGESWARSMQETIWGMLFGGGLLDHITAAHTDVDPKYRVFIELCREMWLHGGIEGGLIPNGSAATAEQLAAAHDRYNDQVIATIPAERLLVWKPADGWEPLCEFLEVPVPAEPIPHVNDTEAFKAGIVRGGLAAVESYLTHGSGSVAVAHPGARPDREDAPDSTAAAAG
jgi:Sulfotransferase domain